MDSSYYESDANSNQSSNSYISTNLNTSQPQSEAASSQFSNSKYNKANYTFSDTKSYIFDNKLFNRTLLDIDINKEREMLIECTTCSVQLVVLKRLKKFLAFNHQITHVIIRISILLLLIIKKAKKYVKRSLILVLVLVI